MGQTVDQAGQRAGRSLDDVRTRGAALGAALGATLGSATLLLGEFGRAAAEEEAVFARLQQSVEATGRSYDEYSQAIDRAIARGEDLAFSDDQVADALARLTTTTGDAQVALDNIGLAMDLARARGIDLSTSADLIGRAHEGSFASLSRYGIKLDENATATEALAAIQAKTAGQAEAYGETQAAAIDRARNSLDNFTESIGAHAGQVSTLVALLPGITAGWTLVSSAAGGITGALTGGAGATAALTAFGSALGTVALAAGAAAPAIAVVGYTAYTAKDNIKAVTAETKALNEALTTTGQAQDEYMRRVYAAFSQNLSLVEVNVGNTTQTLESSFDELTALQGEFAAAFQESARQAGIDWSIPLDQQADKLAFLIDQVHYYYNLQQQMATANYSGSPGDSGLARTGGRFPGIGPPPRYYGDVEPAGYTGPYQPPQTLTLPVTPQRAGPVPNAGDLANFGNFTRAADELRAYRQELEKTYGAYAGMVEGLNNANDAQTAFAATQNILIQDQSVYGQQQSEYQGQLSALESAYNILQERQANGVQLTEEEQALLDNYPELYGRLQGGVEDATIAQGLLAAQYAENMKKGDELNASLEGNTSATGDLVEVVELLILSLDGVPDEVKTQIMLNNISDYMGDINSYITLLNSIPRNIATTLTTTQYLDYVPGSATSPFPGGLHGGVMGYADGGVVARMGEAGGELLHFRDGGMGLALTDGLYNVPRGTFVTPAPATKAALGNLGGGGITINNPVIYVYPATGDVEREFTSAIVGEWR